MPVPSARSQLARTTVAAVTLGAFSTAADWVWSRYLTDGAVLPGVVHGILVFLLLALVLGWAAESRQVTWRLVRWLPLAGLLLAAAFYPLAHLLGYLGALLATWFGMWVTLAFLQRWARDGVETVATTLVRGLVAATSSGLAFWAVSGMWTDPAFSGGFGLRLSYWTFAFLPGFLALILRPSSD